MTLQQLFDFLDHRRTKTQEDISIYRCFLVQIKSKMKKKTPMLQFI